MRCLKLVLIAMGLAAFAGCPYADSAKKGDSKKEIEGGQKDDAVAGKKDAEKDIEAGILKIYSMPLPSPPWAAKHFQLAKEKGITFKSTRTVEEFKTRYYSAYNKRMTAEIEKKFGAGFLGKLESKAKGG